MFARFSRLKYAFAHLSRLRYGFAKFSRLRYGFAIFGGRASIPISDMLQTNEGKPIAAAPSNEVITISS